MRISDWSSDVCSSDLIADAVLMVLRRNPRQRIGLVAMTLEILLGDTTEDAGEAAFGIAFLLQVARLQQVGADLRRSEERRVGKECGSTCRSWWSPYHKKTKKTSHTITDTNKIK